jgi:hypothetical protein
VAARGPRRPILCFALCLLLVACAGAEAVEPRAVVESVPAPPPTATAPTTVVVVTNGQLAGPSDPFDRVPKGYQSPARVAAPPAAPTATPVPPTPTPPAPRAAPQRAGARGAGGAVAPSPRLSDLTGRADARWLPVPYRSQLDGNPYQLADCGPASMAMVLAAYGRNVPTMEVRTLVGKLQGTEGLYDTGTLLESIHTIMERYGMAPSGLFEGGGRKGFRRWTLAEVRRALDTGKPIIPQVWYRGLPGREQKSYNGDHYIVLVGYVGEEFIYHDPIDTDGPGDSRRMSAAQLDKAWRNGDFPYAGVAVGGPAGQPSLVKG